MGFTLKTSQNQMDINTIRANYDHHTKIKYYEMVKVFKIRFSNIKHSYHNT
jgi:hypothetical protein